MCIMYGQPRQTSVNAVRSALLKKMVEEDNTLSVKSRVDLVRLPPCLDSLVPHIQRVNYRVACYKLAAVHVSVHPKPYEGQGWVKTDEGFMEPVWSRTAVLPDSLVDLLDTNQQEEQQEDTEDEENDEFIEIEDFEDLQLFMDDDI